MIKLFLSTFFLTVHFAYAQSTDSITKIRIEYGKSYNSWGAPGIYSRAETIELSKTQNGDFKIFRYFMINASAGSDGKTFSKDTKELNTKDYDIISKEKIQFWITQLNTNKENFSESFIRPKLKAPTKKVIFKIAKKYDKLWLLKGSDANRKDTKRAISEIQRFYRLDSFLTFIRPTIEYDMVVIDSYNKLRIQTINNNDTTEYQCQFFEPLGQPIYRFDKRNFRMKNRVFNFEANTSAQLFLPKKSLASKVLDLNNIKELYIKWYLDKVIFEY